MSTVSKILIRLFRVLMASWLISIAPHAQTLNPSARTIVAQSRTLTQAEVAQVVGAARDAIAGRTFKLSYQPGGPGPEVLMAANGRPRFVRTVSGYTSWSGSSRGSSSGGTSTTSRETQANAREITEFTGRPARRCDGSATDGELVIEYRNEDQRGWTAKARTRTPMEFAAPVFDILTGVVAVEDGAAKTIGDRRARAFVAPWKPPAGSQPGGPLVPNLTQSLWIDVETLLPLRWDVNAPTAPGYGVSFTYEAIDIRAPVGVVAPECI
jgi:hypothetical protein